MINWMFFIVSVYCHHPNLKMVTHERIAVTELVRPRGWRAQIFWLPRDNLYRSIELET